MTLHPRFTYNGYTFQSESLKDGLKELRSSAAAWEQQHLDFIADWITDDAFISVQTSGSSGTPSIWNASKEAMRASALRTGEFFDCYEGSSALLVLPSSFIAGKMMLVRAMTLGWNLTAIEPKAEPARNLSESYDFAAFTPMQLASASHEDLEKLSKFGAVILGGAAVSSELRSKLALVSGNFYETYGMAETLSHIALRKMEVGEKPFVALNGVYFTTDDRGCLEIDASYLAEEKIQTNDVVELINNTSFYYRGRLDRMINSGGIKLFAEVIERKLAGLIDVPYAISSESDAVLGEKVVLYIEGELGASEQHLQTAMANVLERYEVPKSIYVVEQLERTESGKLKIIRKP
jgi:O-succinylbenzoic acid--CoA ligase